jgi:hypothetical protein
MKLLPWRAKINIYVFPISSLRPFLYKLEFSPGSFFELPSFSVLLLHLISDGLCIGYTEKLPETKRQRLGTKRTGKNVLRAKTSSG